MPHLDRWPIQQPDTSYAPTPHMGFAAACYDGRGQALYAAATIQNMGGPTGTGGSFNIYRTRDGYRKLTEEDNSVDLVTVVCDGIRTEGSSESPTARFRRTNCGIQRMPDGKIYTNISARFPGSREAMDIYRDESELRDGSGPWVLHGTVYERVVDNYWGDRDVGSVGGEIVVLPSGRWMISSALPNQLDFYGARYGVSTSGDGGVTWTMHFNVGWYSGGIHGYGCQKNWAYWDGHWYWGGNGNVDPGKHYKSPDGVNWTDIGSMGTGNSEGYDFFLSTPDMIYMNRIATGVGSSIGDDTTGTFFNDVVTLAPGVARPDDVVGRPNQTTSVVHLFAWSQYHLNPGGYSHYLPFICQIGPDWDPYWVAMNYGRVIGFQFGGWSIKQIRIT